MIRCALFFFAGWFSAVIGFEIAPMWGNIAGVTSFVVLIVWVSYLDSR